MLEIRPSCENCDTPLPNESDQAMICTFECTFCKDCVENILQNVCPNCRGGFQKRPIRPKDQLLKYPAKGIRVFKPVVENPFLKQNLGIPPEER